MRVASLKLTNFRNYSGCEIDLSPGVNVLFGDNGQGKTNALEAVYYACAGRSHRTRQDRELIKNGEMFARATLSVERRDGGHEIDVRLFREDRRKILINGTQISRSGELMGHLVGVLFSPEDLRTVKDGPAERRRFVDIALSEIDPGYYYALQRHARALRQRNEALRSESTAAELDAWEDQLARAGAVLMQARRNYVEKLSRIAGNIHRDIVPAAGDFSLQYAPDVTEGDDAETLRRAFHQSRKNDLRRGTTTVGAHRDDVMLRLGDMDVRSFGSQGQQRTAALCMRLAELELIKEELGEYPVLMLDDVMSELDPSRRRQLIRYLGGVQTIITCTDMSDLADISPDRAFRVQNAAVTQE